MEHPRLGTIKVPGVVPKFSSTPGAIRHRAPELGEHNEEIFRRKTWVIGRRIGCTEREGGYLR
ncbi:hypothetical protein GCM10020331_026550 [Ectobacillus funiculus]